MRLLFVLLFVVMMAIIAGNIHTRGAPIDTEPYCFYEWGRLFYPCAFTDDLRDI